MKRLLALVAALLMIVGALALRSRVVDDDGDGGNDRTEPASSEGDGSLVIGCVTELMAACRTVDGVEVVEADPADALDLATAAEIDAWMTFEPWPEMAQIELEADQRPFTEATALGQQPIVVVIDEDRREALATGCADDVGWKCLIAQADRPWSTIDPASTLLGGFRLGLGDRRSALDQLLVGHIVGATTEIETEGATEVDLDPIIRALGSADPAAVTTQLDLALAQGPGAYSAVIALRDRAEAGASSSQGQQRNLTVLTPEPAGAVRLVLAPVDGGDDLGDVAGPLREALAEDGWGRADAETNLPDADLLVALGERLAR